jgi:LuxR family maltose regulon positive regulatory protein
MIDFLRTSAARPAAEASYLAQLLSHAGVARPAGEHAPLEMLTPREHEILRLLADGLSNREIAARLVIAESTLKRHLSNFYLKLAAHSRTQALARARAAGLIQ